MATKLWGKWGFGAKQQPLSASKYSYFTRTLGVSFLSYRSNKRIVHGLVSIVSILSLTVG